MHNRKTCQCAACKSCRGEYSGKNHPMFGRTHAKSSRKKMSNKATGKKLRTTHKRGCMCAFCGNNPPKHTKEQHRKAWLTRKKKKGWRKFFKNLGKHNSLLYKNKTLKQIGHKKNCKCMCCKDKHGKNHPLYGKKSKALSSAKRRYWRNLSSKEKSDIIQRCFGKCFLKSPNKCEKLLLKIINTIYPGLCRLNVNGKIKIGGKVPDIVYRDGTKKCIEHHGTYWHRSDHANRKIAYYRARGWKCLVIWESELKRSPKSVIRKIIRFHEQKWL